VDRTDKICGLWLYLITPIALLFYLSAELYLTKKSETGTKIFNLWVEKLQFKWLSFKGVNYERLNPSYLI